MAYDANDERGNDPRKVKRRLGVTDLPDSNGNGYMPGPSGQVGMDISPGSDKPGYADNGILRRK